MKFNNFKDLTHHLLTKEENQNAYSLRIVKSEVNLDYLKYAEAVGTSEDGIIEGTSFQNPYPQYIVKFTKPFIIIKTKINFTTPTFTGSVTIADFKGINMPSRYNISDLEIQPKNYSSTSGNDYYLILEKN